MRHSRCTSETTQAEEVALGLGLEHTWAGIPDQVLNPTSGSGVGHWVGDVRDWNMLRAELKRGKAARSECWVNALICPGETWPTLASLGPALRMEGAVIWGRGGQSFKVGKSRCPWLTDHWGTRVTRQREQDQAHSPVQLLEAATWLGATEV